MRRNLVFYIQAFVMCWFFYLPDAQAQRVSFMNRSDETVVDFAFSNDIFFKTDKYFSNGVRLAVYNDFLKETPLHWVNLKTTGPRTDYYQGISIVSNLYTPANLNDTGIQVGDRPYASYIMFGICGVSNNKAQLYRLSSEFSAGILGKSAFGKQIQSLAHIIPPNNPPNGWDKQLSNTLLVQYSARLDYLLLEAPGHVEGFLTTAGNLGTANIDAAAGYFLRLGVFDGYLGSLGPNNRRNVVYKRLRGYQLYVRFGQEMKLVGYDATMEGGMIKEEKNVYTIPSSDIKRKVYNTHAGLGITVRGFCLDLRADFLTAQFKGATDQRWGTIRTALAF